MTVWDLIAAGCYLLTLVFFVRLARDPFTEWRGTIVCWLISLALLFTPFVVLYLQ